MTRHLLLALPLAILACSAEGGSGEPPGGTGGGLCIEFGPEAVKVLGRVDDVPGSGLWRQDPGSAWARPQLGPRGELTSHIVDVAKDHLALSTPAGSMRFGWAGAFPGGLSPGEAKVYQRDGWDYVSSGALTLAIFWSPEGKPPPSVKAGEGGTKASFTKIEVLPGCTAETGCGDVEIGMLVIDGVSIYPGFSAEVAGWTVWNHGLVAAPDTCEAETATLVTAVRLEPH